MTLDHKCKTPILELSYWLVLLIILFFSQQFSYNIIKFFNNHFRPFNSICCNLTIGILLNRNSFRTFLQTIINKWCKFFFMSTQIRKYILIWIKMFMFFSKFIENLFTCLPIYTTLFHQIKYFALLWGYLYTLHFFFKFDLMYFNYNWYKFLFIFYQSIKIFEQLFSRNFLYEKCLDGGDRLIYNSFFNVRHHS